LNVEEIINLLFDQSTIPVVQDIPQVSSVYIFCENKMWLEKWAKEWPKVTGVYTDIALICESLKQAAPDCDQNLISISFVKNTATPSNQNLNELDQSFVYTQILKDILLTIDFEQEYFTDFLTYCREQFLDHIVELKNVEEEQVIGGKNIMTKMDNL
jgi:hypothetical protein